MADKDTVADWSTTPDDNDNVGGVPLGENVMYPRHVNNAFRNMMAQIAAAGFGSGDGDMLAANNLSDVADVATAISNLSALLASIAGLTGANGDFLRITGASTAVMQAIVGTVSQSSGVPTGAIVETGTNANGTYTRWADGTQICICPVASRSVAFTSATGSQFRSAAQYTVTFPAVFVSIASAKANESVGVPGSEVTELTDHSWYVWSNTTLTIASVGQVIAMGRWF